MNSNQKPTFIDTPKKLAELVKTLTQQNEIAVDTESNGLFAYQEQVCLLQFSIPQMDYVLDSLAIPDLSPLAELFSNEKIIKVFHAAEYDVICLKRDFNFVINNLFDTMLASRVLGMKTLGLGKILEERFRVHAQKKYQRADWGKRPLTSEMINYATTDTRYLLELKKQLSEELKSANRTALAEEEFNRISNVNGSERTSLEDSLRKLAVANRLNPQANAILFELLKMRDKRAQKRDVPVFKIIGDKALVAIAEYMPSDRKSLDRIEFLSPRVVSRHANWLLKGVRDGSKKEGIVIKRKKKWDGDYSSRVDRIKKWRRQAAASMQVESDVVLPREIMETLAWKHPRTLEEIQEIMKTIPWRFEHFKEEILELYSD